MNKLIDELATNAFDAGATDLFLSEDQIPRARVDNEIRNSDVPAVSHESMEAFWQDCNADPDITHEKDTSHVTSAGRRFRVNLYKSLGLL